MPYETAAEDDTGLVPFYRGYSDSARSIIAINPYLPGSPASKRWAAGSIEWSADERLRGVRQARSIWPLI